MSKIKIKAILKNSKEIYQYQGKGLLKENRITYIDNNIKTVVVLDNVISIIRKADYQISLNFKKDQLLNSYYQNKYGIIPLKVQTTYLEKHNNFLEIHYSLWHTHNKIEEFIFILEYSLDT